MRVKFIYAVPLFPHSRVPSVNYANSGSIAPSHCAVREEANLKIVPKDFFR